MAQVDTLWIQFLSPCPSFPPSNASETSFCSLQRFLSLAHCWHHWITCLHSYLISRLLFSLFARLPPFIKLLWLKHSAIEAWCLLCPFSSNLPPWTFKHKCDRLCAFLWNSWSDILNLSWYVMFFGRVATQWKSCILLFGKLFHLQRKLEQLHLAQKTFLSLEHLHLAQHFPLSALPCPPRSSQAPSSHSVVSDRKLPWIPPSHILPLLIYIQQKTIHQIILLRFRIVPFSEKYSKIMYAVQEASEYGKQADAVCANKYSWWTKKPGRICPPKTLETCLNWTWPAKRSGRQQDSLEVSQRSGKEEERARRPLSKPCAALPKWDPEPWVPCRRLRTLNLKVGKMGFAKIIRNPGALVLLLRSSNSWIWRTWHWRTSTGLQALTQIGSARPITEGPASPDDGKGPEMGLHTSWPKPRATWQLKKLASPRVTVLVSTVYELYIPAFISHCYCYKVVHGASCYL